MNGYLSGSVPVYFGADRATQREVLNTEAYVWCDVPVEVRRVLWN